MRTKNIIFDFGGVLLHIDYHLMEKAFVDLGFKNFPQVYSQAAQVKLFDDFEKGRIPEKSFFEELKKLSGLESVTTEQLKKAWEVILVSFPVSKYSMLKKLEGRYDLFLLSNTNEAHISGFEKLIEKVCPVSEFESLFRHAYYSCRIGLKKPDAECFEKIITENNFDLSETIFIDDSKQHVLGAQKAGITSYWLEAPKTTETLLEELHLL